MLEKIKKTVDEPRFQRADANEVHPVGTWFASLKVFTQPDRLVEAYILKVLADALVPRRLHGSIW